MSVIIALPFICLLITTMIDFGRLPLIMGDLTNASAVLARTIEVSPDTTNGKLKEQAIAVAPSISALNPTIEIEYQPSTQNTYTHHYFDQTTSTFKTRPSHTTTKSFVVHITITGDWITPFGELAGGGKKQFSYVSASTGTLDTTVTGGAW